MSDPKIDLAKLKAVREWAEDLSDELNRQDVLPCKNVDRLGDCISRQRRYLVEEMKHTKMCPRCQARWHVMMALAKMGTVYSAKTELPIEGSPNFK